MATYEDRLNKMFGTSGQTAQKKTTAAAGPTNIKEALRVVRANQEPKRQSLNIVTTTSKGKVKIDKPSKKEIYNAYGVDIKTKKQIKNELKADIKSTVSEKKTQQKDPNESLISSLQSEIGEARAKAPTAAAPSPRCAPSSTPR